MYIHIKMANLRELSLAHGVHVGKNSRRKLDFYCLDVKQSGNLRVPEELGIGEKAVSENNYRKGNLI